MQSEYIHGLTWFLSSRDLLALEPQTRRAGRSRRGDRSPSENRSPAIDGNKDQPRPIQSLWSEQDSQTSEPVVLVPLDFSVAAENAARLGVNIASYTRAKLIFCHALFSKAVPFARGFSLWLADSLRYEAIKKAQPALNLAKKSGLDATCVIEQGTPAQVILNVARQFSAALIVLTSRDRNIWARLFFGPNTTERVTREAECHVVVARARS